MVRPLVFCPVDFSESSRGTLRFAATIAEHFYAGLTVVTINDPLPRWDESETKKELEWFVTEALRERQPQVAELQLEVATGKPAIEILRMARDRKADVIVMSTHGRRGAAKTFFGSTTERVLRETTIPVLVTPAGDPGPVNLEELRRSGGVLAPVDLTPYSRYQLSIAQGLAVALQTPLTIVHVLEPIFAITGREAIVEQTREANRRYAAEELAALAASISGDKPPAVILLDGDPAAEIARLASTEGMSAIVMGLHGNGAHSPRMGSVTYRVLCQSNALVLAIPPRLRSEAEAHDAGARAAALAT